MKKLSFTNTILAAITLTAGFSLAGAMDDGISLEQLAGYRQWTRVTPEPVAVGLISDGG